MAGSCTARVRACTATSGGGKSASPAPTSITSTPCSISRRLIAGSSAIGYVGSALTRWLNPPKPNSPSFWQEAICRRLSAISTDGRRLMADCSNLARPLGNGRADAVQGEELFELPPHVRPVADRFGGRRQAFQHRGPVAFSHHPPVQQDNSADIRFGSYQTPETLFQLERRERNEIVGEAIHPRFGETLQPRRG